MEDPQKRKVHGDGLFPYGCSCCTRPSFRLWHKEHKMPGPESFRHYNSPFFEVLVFLRMFLMYYLF